MCVDDEDGADAEPDTHDDPPTGEVSSSDDGG